MKIVAEERALGQTTHVSEDRFVPIRRSTFPTRSSSVSGSVARLHRVSLLSCGDGWVKGELIAFSYGSSFVFKASIEVVCRRFSLS
jgi:hypothetical protein